MRRTICALLVAVLLISIGTTAIGAGSSSAGQITVFLDGRKLDFEVPPQLINGRTMVPMRGVFSELGAAVEWDGATQTVTAKKGDTVIALQIGSTEPTINGQVRPIDQPGIVIAGRTLVPLRFVAEAFNIIVDWNPATNTVTIGEQISPPPQNNNQTPGTIQATITMEDGGIIELELYPDVAPQSVRNFVYLARQGFYDGLRFHRIISGFMIQGGCPNGSGTGNPGYSIHGEFKQNGFENDIKHVRGVLSMARAAAPNSAGSQFFIVHANSPNLDGQYAAFGRVVSGMDVVDRIAATPNNGPNGSVAAANMPVIKTITIDSDIELPEPEKLPR